MNIKEEHSFQENAYQLTRAVVRWDAVHPTSQ